MASYDWLNEDWVETHQAVEIVQADASATVIGVAGRYGLKRAHLVEVLSPGICAENELVRHPLSRPYAGISTDTVHKAVKFECFAWGTLVSLNWNSLGYAPGGLEYWLLPPGGPAISVGLLWLDWASVRIHQSV